MDKIIIAIVIGLALGVSPIDKIIVIRQILRIIGGY